MSLCPPLGQPRIVQDTNRCLGNAARGGGRAAWSQTPAWTEGVLCMLTRTISGEGNEQ